MVDFYRQDYVIGGSDTETLSAINLSAIPDLATRVNNFANAMLSNFTPNNLTIKNARDNSESFEVVAYKDLQHYASLIATVNDYNIQNAAQAVINSVNDAIIANSKLASVCYALVRGIKKKEEKF